MLLSLFFAFEYYTAMPSAMKKTLYVTGIMTGNSLDAVDIATFKVALLGSSVESFKQVSFYSSPCSEELRAHVLDLKNKLRETRGRITPLVEQTLSPTHLIYHQAVNAALSEARRHVRAEAGADLDLIGFHGQTLGHAPPSITARDARPYTIQLVDGGRIADAQSVVTVADFRSDDLLNGGEGAPFAPAFNAFLASTLGVDKAVFINAGNTSNIALITSSTQHVRGWDCGPCNQFPDLLMREERGALIDNEGAIAARGAVNGELLRLLWEQSVSREDGANALEVEGPRSFDPQWYRLPPELRDSRVPFEDRLRTVVAFSAYCIAHSLAIAAKSGYQPEKILLFGGGWKNCVLAGEFRSLLQGSAHYVIPKHQHLFRELPLTFRDLNSLVASSDEVGLPSNGMEAGIFAFAALQRVLNRPFTHPSFTNCKSPTICGAVFLPRSGAVSETLQDLHLRDQRDIFKDLRLSRAAPDNQSRE